MKEVDGWGLDVVRLPRSGELALPCGQIPPLGETDLHVWVLSLDQSSQLDGQFSKLLSPEEQQCASRYAAHRLHRRYAAHAQMRLILAGYAHAYAASLVFGEGPAGKPFLKDNAIRQAPFFNLAHSGGVARGRADRKCRSQHRADSRL